MITSHDRNDAFHDTFLLSFREYYPGITRIEQEEMFSYRLHCTEGLGPHDVSDIVNNKGRPLIRTAFVICLSLLHLDFPAL